VFKVRAALVSVSAYPSKTVSPIPR